jgi:YD repeat-containing protein
VLIFVPNVTNINTYADDNKAPARLLTLAMASDASAQSRTIYDSAGRVVGRSSTDGQGTVTDYDARGRVISRESTTGSGTTTVYDPAGRNVGRFTTGR